MLDFHKIGKGDRPYDIIDDKIANYIIEHENIIVISGKPYIYKNGVYKRDEDGNILRYLIKSMIIEELVTIHRINRVYSLILCNHKLRIENEDVNRYPAHWINFKNGMLDILSGAFHEHSPKYLSINQIPHNYIAGLPFEESTFKRFLDSRITDADSRKMLYEFMGYCMTKDISFQKFMMLHGIGDSGKSTIIKFLTNIVGKDNTCSIPLQGLSDRFTTASLLFKILNTCGDISSAALKDTSIIKQITGDDNIKGEYKGGAIFFFRNHAKMMFSCNELPVILDEKSNGFYRRLLIVKFTESGEFIPGLAEKLADESEIEIVISHLIEAYRGGILRGSLFESGESLSEVSALRHDSDTVSAFLEDWVVEELKAKIPRDDLYSYYVEYCKEEQRMALGRNSFFKSMRTKQFQDRKSHGIWYFFGIEIPFRKSKESEFD